MGNADDHYLSHLEQAKYMPKPYGLVSGITKVLLKITSAKLFWYRYVYMSIIGSAVPKIHRYGAKNLGCRADFLCV